MGDSTVTPPLLYGSFSSTMWMLFIVLSLLNILRSAMYAYAELVSSRSIFKLALRSTMYAKMTLLDEQHSGVGFVIDRLF